MAEQQFRICQVDERGRLTGAALDGVREMIPEGGGGWSAERQAKAQGYWVEHSEEPPTETTKYGVPVVWVAKRALGAQIPVRPFTPSVNLARRIITIPQQIGVKYTIDGVVTKHGDFTVPGNDARTVTIEALAESEMYVLPSIFRWERQFGTIANRVIWASDTFDGRIGEALVPPLPEEERTSKNDFKIRYGAVWNNKAGGTASVQWTSHGHGVATVGGEVKPTSWFVRDDKGATVVAAGGLTSGIVFETGTPNISLELDISEVRENSDISIMFGQTGKLLNVADGTTVGFSLRKDGVSSNIRDIIQGAPFLGKVNGGPSVGTWRFDFLDGITVITSPSGIQVVQDRSPLAHTRYGRYCKIFWSGTDAFSISAVRVYKSPEA